MNVTVSRSILENQTSDQYVSILNEFINLDIKIIIGVFDINTTVKLFCEIFKLNMYGKNYQWIILGSYNDEIKSMKFTRSHCSNEEILTALNGTLQTRVIEYSHDYETQFKYAVGRKKSVGSIGSKTNFEHHFSDIVESYLNKIYLDSDSDTNKSPCHNSYFHGYAFDVLLSIFKVLSSLIDNKKFSCNDLKFERNIEWFSLLNNAFNKISFKGVTVRLEKFFNCLMI